MDLACQRGPAPGHVSIVEAEEPLVVIRASSSHWAKETGSLLFRFVGERADRAGGWAGRRPCPLSLPHSAATVIGGQWRGSKAHRVTYTSHAHSHVITTPHGCIYTHGVCIPCSYANTHVYNHISAHTCTHVHALRHLPIPAWGIHEHTHTRTPSLTAYLPHVTHVSDLHTQLQSCLKTYKHAYSFP